MKISQLNHIDSSCSVRVVCYWPHPLLHTRSNNQDFFSAEFELQMIMLVQYCGINSYIVWIN